MTLKPKVALSNDFLIQLSKLPHKLHGKVMKWAIQFQADPTSLGIHYEHIKGAQDPHLKSVRLDDDWRGIVFKPSSGDVYVLLYVDHHDAAYRWAENRKLTINPVTGAMQLITVEQVRETPPSVATPTPMPKKASSASPLFVALSDHDLMSLGVPQELLPAVRALTSEEGLDALQARLPIEAYEGLFLVAAGDGVGQVLHERETRVDRVIDTADFAAALDTPESLSRFVVISDDESLSAILNAPLAQWRVFLHPTQHKLAMGDRSGAVRVLGGAGTGKTVLAMHRARWLAEHRTDEGQKVLLTTFTRNLAIDIEHNMRTLCSPSTLSKLEVTNLDAWVHGYMRSKKFEHRIIYDRKKDGAAQAWQLALTVKETGLDLPDHFYEDELEQVILAQGITTLDQYRMARRTGRGVVLSRAKREAVWPVFEEYRGQLASRKLKEVDDAYREVTELLQAEQHQMTRKYSAVVVDETQDFGPQALKLLRALLPSGPNDLFFVGDGHQRIYSRNKAAMSKCGIDIRGRSKKLYINYRTTDEIRRQAVALLEGVEVDDLDDGHDESTRYRSLSHGPAPEVIRVSDMDGAFKAVKQFWSQWEPSSSPQADLTFCVVASSEKSRDTLTMQLQQGGFRTVSVTAETRHTDEKGVMYMATMHRAKGLEFDCVVVVAPASYVDGAPDDSSTRKQLLYVALTRAKRGAVLVLEEPTPRNSMRQATRN